MDFLDYLRRGFSGMNDKTQGPPMPMNYGVSGLLSKLATGENGMPPEMLLKLLGSQGLLGGQSAVMPQQMISPVMLGGRNYPVALQFGLMGRR